MPDQNPTVTDWIAEGAASIAVHCGALGCGHFATIRLDTLDPRMTRDEIGRRARCATCGHRGGTVMRDMAAYYEDLRATGWDDKPGPWRGPARREVDEDEPF